MQEELERRIIFS